MRYAIYFPETKTMMVDTTDDYDKAVVIAEQVSGVDTLIIEIPDGNEPEAEVCTECGASIPDADDDFASGVQGMANQHHDPSCSLYTPPS